MFEDESYLCAATIRNLGIPFHEIKVRVKYVEPILGSLPFNEELHETYIASKAPNAMNRSEEVAALGVDAVVEEGMTGFARDSDGNPMNWDYQWKGFLKESAYFMKQVDGSLTSKAKVMSAYRKRIDGLVFVEPRRIPFVVPQGKEMTTCQRPLRAQTAQGERIALANSEQLPAGCEQEFSVIVLMEELVPLVKEWLNYGLLHGTGQWRNSGMGRFVWEEVIEEEKPAKKSKKK